MSPRQMIIIGVFAVLFLGLFAWRVRRMMTATPFNPYRAWILPLIFVALLGTAIWRAWPLSATEWLWLVVAALIGGVVGWFRGKSISMTYIPEKAQLLAQGGAMAMVFIVGLIVVRTGLNFYIHANGQALHLRSEGADAIFATMGTGLFIARSIEMGLRGHRLLMANRANPQIATTEAAGV